MLEGWEATTLGRVAATVAPSKAPELPTRYVGLEHFDSGSPRLTRWGSTAGVSSMTTAFRGGDVLFSKLRPYLRKVAVADFEGRCTTEALVYRPTRGDLDAGYLALLLQSDAALSHADSTSAGSRMPRTSVQIMASLEVALPSLPEQRRIVDVVAAMDDAILATELAGDRARSAAVAVIVRPWPIDVDNVPLETVFEHVIGGTWGDPPRVSDVPVLALGPKSYAGRLNVDASSATPRSLSTKRAAERLLRPGDIVLERSGGSPVQPVGRVIRMVPGEAVNVVPSDFQRLLRPDAAKADPSYIFWSMWANYEAGAVIPFQKASTSIRNLNIPAYLSQVPIALPARSEQVRFAALAEAFASVVAGLHEQAKRLRAVRSNLLIALLSGEHEVPGSYDELMGEAS